MQNEFIGGLVESNENKKQEKYFQNIDNSEVVKCNKDLLYNKQLPDFHSLGIVFGISLVLCVIGWLIFNKLQRRFAEEV